MKIEDVIDSMSKSFLEKIVKSFITGYYQKDEDGYRDQIRSNVDHLAKSDTIETSIKSHLSSSKTPYQDTLLIQFVLDAFLRSQDFILTEADVIDMVVNCEKDIIKQSKSNENFKHISDEAYSLFEILLEAALEDESISEDEMHLIKAVRKKLGMHQTDHYLIQAKMKSFPRKGNQVHSAEEVIGILGDLQKAGVVFFGNKLKPQAYVLPEELVDGVKNYLGIELVTEKFKDLLETLLLSELKDVMVHLNLKQTGTKEELIARSLIAGIKPSEVLNLLSNQRLSDLCKSLPKLKVSGSKDDKIQRIISYFDELANISTGVGEDGRELYYNYYEYLARLDMANLLSKKIVKNEGDAALAFERATHYLFETKLGHEPLGQGGTEHSDGCLKFNPKGDLMMWDNKAMMNGAYGFPNDHFRQFKRYIMDSGVRGSRVNCFLIIVPEIDESAKDNTLKLKYESGSDTDIAIITAENLKWLAEDWSNNKLDKPLNLEVFNTTGILTKEELKSRLKVFK